MILEVGKRVRIISRGSANGMRVFDPHDSTLAIKETRIIGELVMLEK